MRPGHGRLRCGERAHMRGARRQQGVAPLPAEEPGDAPLPELAHQPVDLPGDRRDGPGCDAANVQPGGRQPVGVLRRGGQQGPHHGDDPAEVPLRHRRRLVPRVALREGGAGRRHDQAPEAAPDHAGRRRLPRRGLPHQGAGLPARPAGRQAVRHQGDGRLLGQRGLAALAVQRVPRRGRRQVRRHLRVPGLHRDRGDGELVHQLPQGPGRDPPGQHLAAKQGRQG
mmetsp:Transcript_66731/g.171835  ORF Transcript_66731/g.171835 Transcript_66731/m.171835 type:complete len:226 (-) Transcript_66731:144-821(-)